MGDPVRDLQNIYRLIESIDSFIIDTPHLARGTYHPALAAKRELRGCRVYLESLYGRMMYDGAKEVGEQIYGTEYQSHSEDDIPTM